MKGKYLIGVCIIALLASTSLYFVEKNKVANLKAQVENLSVQASNISNKQLSQEAINLIEGYSLVDEVSYTSPANNDTANIKLFIDAKRSPDGHIMFDDSNRWLLLADVKGKNYVLFDEEVYTGDIEAYVYLYPTADSNNLHVTIIRGQSAGFVVQEFVKEPMNDYFEESTDYPIARIGINLLGKLCYEDPAPAK